MQLTRPRIEIAVGPQTLSLWDGFHLVRQWPCSTSRYGLGFEEGSYKTPLGAFRLYAKFGDNAPWNTRFKAKAPYGEWDGKKTSRDLILARVMCLEGLDDLNANTKSRYIYIHGTNQEDDIGKIASYGCIRLKNAAVMELYDLVPVGVPLWIRE